MGAVEDKHVAGVPSAEAGGNKPKYETAYYGRARLITIDQKKKGMNVKSSSGSIGNISDKTLIVRILCAP